MLVIPKVGKSYPLPGHTDFTGAKGLCQENNAKQDVVVWNSAPANPVKQQQPASGGLLNTTCIYFFFLPFSEADTRAGGGETFAVSPAVIACAGAFERMTAQASTPSRAAAIAHTK